jgi:hypothetical protein
MPRSANHEKCICASNIADADAGAACSNTRSRIARRLDFHRVILESASKLPKALALYRSYGFQHYVAKHFAPRCDQTLQLHLTPP